MTGIYDEPWAYELACAFRDVPAEVDALLRWSARHRPGDLGDAQSVLELAAGPAEHAREFARRGLSATALDLNPAMCAYAAEQAAAAGVELTVVQADMTDFVLDERFDLIITMLDSTSHLMTLDAFVDHLRRVAGQLTGGGGLYILEMSHPADRLSDEPRTGTAWEIEFEGVSGTVRWGEPGDRLDPITQIADDRVTVTVTRDGATRVIRDVVPYRFWTATELAAAVRLAGSLEVVAQYGDFTGIGVRDPEAWRLITVLRPISPP